MVNGARWIDNDPHAQAAYWLARQRSGTFSRCDQRAFLAWRDSSDTHTAAFERAERAWNCAASLEADAGIRKLCREALIPARSRAFPVSLLRSIAASATLVFAAALLWSAFKPASLTEPVEVAVEGRVFKTEVGERSAFVLDDGSTVELNTNTELRVRIGDDLRTVVLLTGQALFEVAKDERRPFVVLAGDKRITALGTKFEVRQSGDDVDVTLIEGRVKVDEVGSAHLIVRRPIASMSYELEAGQRYSSSGKVLSVLSQAEIDRSLSWREGRLDFLDEELASVVKEINRYSTQPLRLAGSGLSELRISGSFKAGSTQNFATALTALYPVEVRRSEDDTAIIVSWEDDTGS